MRKLLSVLFLASLTQASETWVIAAGVEQYDDPGISALQYAAADARAVAEAFRAAGVPDKNVELYVNGAAERLSLPTRANLLRALQRARTRATGDDTLVFLFAGHGIEQNGQAYLLTVDTNRELLNDTALSMDLVDKALSGFEGGHVLFLIDACRNDPDAGRGQRDCPLTDGLARGLRPKLAERGQSARPAALLLACDVGQRAWEMPDEGHGAFTYWLLQGLRTAGQAGGVRVSALAEYVEQQVSGWARRARREQTPRFNNPSGRDFTLPCPAPAKPTPPQPQPAQPQPTLEPAAPANWEQGVSPTGPKPEGWPDYLQWPPATNPELRFRVCPKDAMPQVLVPAGEFLMGSPPNETGRDSDEGPQKRVYVSAFWMDLHEVTVGQYQEFCQATNRKVPSPSAYGWEDRQPVSNVTWDDATAYCEWAGRRLPTEAEWEKAARCGREGQKYVWGNQWPPPRGAGNFADVTAKKKDKSWTIIDGYDDGYAGVSPVGSFAPNGYGLFDLAGNVLEWCQDWWDKRWYARMPGRDPCHTTEGSARVLRGGPFIPVEPRYLRAATRNRAVPGDRGGHKGFRGVAGAETASTSAPVADPPPTPTPAPANATGWQSGVPPTGPPPAGWPDYLQWPPATNPELRFRVCPKDGMPQVLVPAGEFLMGSPDNEPNRGSAEGPQKRVYVSAFWMDLHEVTVGQYKRFCRATNRHPPSPSRAGWEDRHPVSYVTWMDATAYCQWAGRRLPTEAEWEKAARGGLEGQPYVWGNQWPPPRGAGNFGSISEYDDGHAGVSPVGSFAPNGYGLFDLAGNVWEWCQDWYDEGWYAKMPDRDPCNTTTSSFRAVRGGSFQIDVPRYLRGGCRYRLVPGGRGETDGFRAAADAAE